MFTAMTLHFPYHSQCLRSQSNMELDSTWPVLAQLNHAKNIRSPAISSAGFDFYTFPLPGHHHQRQQSPARAQQDREDLHHRRQQPHCGHLPHHQYVLATPAQLELDLQDLQDPTQPLAPPLLPLRDCLQAAPSPQHLQGSPLKLQDLTR